MSNFNALTREFKFAARERSVWLWLLLVLGLSTLSVFSGLEQVDRQQTTIQQLIAQDQQERAAALNKVKDWGSAAYYSFHLTYDPPSDFAYAALGDRDNQPWKHRVRMLALEGQIYERDVANPSVALIGRFDFAFFTAFVIPLVLIMMLYDLRASERAAGRYALLEATVGHSGSFWLMRAGLRTGLVFLSLVVPLIIAGLLAGTEAYKLILASLTVLVYVLFWMLLCLICSRWDKPSSVILMTLITIWISMAALMPTASRLTIDNLVTVPSGADILLLQRETVNDAWDLPRQQTMDAFFERHPQWSDYQSQGDSFEWQWYYAFQQVGDQKTESLSNAYRNGKTKREKLATWAALLAPPALFEKALQALANTNLTASIEYEQKVRSYHEKLRQFYYPKLFGHQVFDKALLQELPEFNP